MNRVLCVIYAWLLLGCQALPTTCINPAKIRPDAVCTLEYNPVCGCDGNTYGNSCAADKAGVTKYTPGACAGSK